MRSAWNILSACLLIVTICNLSMCKTSIEKIISAAIFIVAYIGSTTRDYHDRRVMPIIGGVLLSSLVAWQRSWVDAI